MKYLNVLFFSLLFIFLPQVAMAQSADSTKNISSFSGSVGITNNGFSIVASDFSIINP